MYSWALYKYPYTSSDSRLAVCTSDRAVDGYLFGVETKLPRILGPGSSPNCISAACLLRWLFQPAVRTIYYFQLLNRYFPCVEEGESYTTSPLTVHRRRRRNVRDDVRGRFNELVGLACLLFFSSCLFSFSSFFLFPFCYFRWTKISYSICFGGVYYYLFWALPMQKPTMTI